MMRLFAAVSAAGAFLCLSACGTPNNSACVEYVDHLNGLSCVDEDISASATCPENLDTAQFQKNCAEFFACAQQAASCDDDGTFVNTVEFDCPEGCQP